MRGIAAPLAPALVLLLAGASLVSAAPDPARGADRHFGIDFALSPQVGVSYARSVGLGLSGIALELVPFYQSRMLRAEAGVAAGSSPIGWQVLAPIRAGVRVPAPPFTVEALAEAAPGVALFQQAILFMIGAGALGRLTWNAGPSFALFLSLGVRCTLCPSYVDFTGIPYSVLDLPLSLGARWTFRAR
jgi:hypothetical protein